MKMQGKMETRNKNYIKTFCRKHLLSLVTNELQIWAENSSANGLAIAIVQNIFWSDSSDFLFDVL